MEKTPICKCCKNHMVRMSLSDYFGLYGLDAFKNPEFVKLINDPRKKDRFIRKENLDKIKRLGIL